MAIDGTAGLRTVPQNVGLRAVYLGLLRALIYVIPCRSNRYYFRRTQIVLVEPRVTLLREKDSEHVREAWFSEGQKVGKGPMVHGNN